MILVDWINLLAMAVATLGLVACIARIVLEIRLARLEVRLEESAGRAKRRLASASANVDTKDAEVSHEHAGDYRTAPRRVLRCPCCREELKHECGEPAERARVRP